MKARSILIPILLSLFTLNAQAIPLLGENAAQNMNALLTLYPDSNDQNLFYFMPNSSAFQMDASSGKATPMFGFTYWGLSPGGPITDAGAFLTFTAHLTSDQGQKDGLAAFIASGKRIAVLPIKESTISLTTTSTGKSPLGKLFDEFNFSAHGGMAEDDIGVNAIMTGIGAKVFRVAIDNSDLMKVDYCTKIQGLGPNFDASITLDYKRIYDDFQAHFSGGGWFTKVQIDAEVEKLRKEGGIVITINGGDAKMAEYVTTVADTVIAKLMIPEIKDSPTSSGSNSVWSFTSYSLSATHREELTSFSWKIIRRDLVEREFCIPVTLSGLKPYYNDVVKNADAPGHP